MAGDADAPTRTSGGLGERVAQLESLVAQLQEVVAELQSRPGNGHAPDDESGDA